MIASETNYELLARAERALSEYAGRGPSNAANVASALESVRSELAEVARLRELSAKLAMREDLGWDDVG